MTVYIQDSSNGRVFSADNPQYWLESDKFIRLTYTKGKEIYRKQCADTLRAMDITTIYTVLRKVSSSGMQRQISLYTIQEGKPCNITYLAAQVLGWRMKGDHLVLNGCGMDMGFHAVYSLSSSLHNGEGYKIRHEWM